MLVELARQRSTAGLADHANLPAMGGTPEQQRRYRQVRIDAGRCGQCGQRAPDPGFVNCGPCRDRIRAWKAANVDRRRVQHRARSAKLRQAALDAYGRTCRCWGEAEEVFLAIDHIDGGGRGHREEIGCTFYDWLRRENYPPGFQTLCHNCNWAKYALGTCPHQLANGDERAEVTPAPDAIDLGEASRPE